MVKRTARARKKPPPRRRRPIGPSSPAASPNRETPPFRVVGVGASAGGFEAFSQLLGALPPQPGFAMIFVQHLAPHHDSALSALLSARTSLPVVEVAEGTRVSPNRVYVTPPNAQM